MILWLSRLEDWLAALCLRWWPSAYDRLWGGDEGNAE